MPWWMRCPSRRSSRRSSRGDPQAARCVPRSPFRHGIAPSTGGNRCRRTAARLGTESPASALSPTAPPARRPTRRPSTAPARSCRSRRSAPPHPSAARSASPRYPARRDFGNASKSGTMTARTATPSGTASAGRRRPGRRASPPRSVPASCGGNYCRPIRYRRSPPPGGPASPGNNPSTWRTIAADTGQSPCRRSWRCCGPNLAWSRARDRKGCLSCRAC